MARMAEVPGIKKVMAGESRWGKLPFYGVPFPN